MSYEEHLENYIQQVANVHLSAKTANSDSLPASQASMLRSIEEHAGKAKDTLWINKATLLRAYNTADMSGKARLEAELKEMVVGIDQLQRELRKLIGG